MRVATFRWWALPLVVTSCLVFSGAQSSRPTPATSTTVARQIIVPDEDRFTPFAITVRVGQPVVWVNNDTDAHTVVSNDAFNTAGNRGVNVLLKANGGKFVLVFRHPGVFPFYCRFHSMLDGHHQPI